MNDNCRVIEHPVIQHKLGYLRDSDTESAEFRNIMKELGRLLAYEATRDLDLREDRVHTPLMETAVRRIAKPPVVVSVMRAGNGMMDGILSALPFASAGHIGIYRDKFINNTVEYYFKIPKDSKSRQILLVDPLVATADTMISCIDRLKQYEVGEITIVTILISPEGLKRIHHFHPEVKVVTASVEEGLNDQGYLLPGIGDAGDRLYHTR
ncbi:uracil phosphoribosyltransferase [Pseudobacteriovorax antillogorgiicola]|uniref:Uracil phosphoribosyltransferase n=1 Tax=Pseudobacteriovorax antillogorgiicola TaxID=1513793 RepID=A0A1Y6CLX1_9BACT|nr:uracil phosphoribosyltransferase [Pseudobacteriovorax antillogorgiicola]TCS47355.1 uracil phosphoribosyltransferase [Pseudobacteriovorax antillogorgiicola]SMF63283.1 uracil phosphoribosyltransferase [Pseudobacteriovorax antillogorgiicola]